MLLHLDKKVSKASPAKKKKTTTEAQVCSYLNDCTTLMEVCNHTVCYMLIFTTKLLDDVQ